jgi:2-keto-4-pentenoate hydratase/2-oxohepta-3-ene-1,7-dioic acid hydratase in catechol pathway
MYLDEDFDFRKVFCLGMNYTDHIAEMNSEVPANPVFFLKPATAIIRDGETIILPAVSKEVHYEVELAVLIGKQGKRIPLHSAYDHIAGYGIGIDVTLRDIQLAGKSKGYPWTLAKGFDTSAPLSQFVPKEEIKNIYHETLSLWVNDILKQHNSPASMVFRIDEIIEYISRFFTLERGDVILTGTPKGVGRLEDGDIVKASLGKIVSLSCNVIKEQ